MNSDSISKVSNIISKNVNSCFTKRETSLNEVVFAIDEIKRILKQEEVRQNQTEEEIKTEKIKKKNLHNEIDFVTKRDSSNLIKSFLIEQFEPDSEVLHLQEYLKNIKDNIKKLESFLEVLLTKKRVIEFNIKKDSEIYFCDSAQYEV